MVRCFELTAAGRKIVEGGMPSEYDRGFGGEGNMPLMKYEMPDGRVYKEFVAGRHLALTDAMGRIIVESLDDEARKSREKRNVFV